MHELALCEAIVDTVTEHAQGRRVRQVNLRIGHFRQVVPDTLTFCWDVWVRNTELESSVLSITSVPAVVECEECASTTTVVDPYRLCGSCGSAHVTMISGEEFLVESLDLESDLVDSAVVNSAGSTPERR